MQVVGLQTFKWSNNFKSLLLLVLFPLLLCLIGSLVLLAFNVYDSGSSSGKSSNVEYRTSNYTDAYGRVYQRQVPYYAPKVKTDPLQKTLSELPFVAPFFFLGTGVWFLIAWAFNRNMITALTGAKTIDRATNPRIYNIVENLCISRGLPVPQLYIIEDDSMNAFASGLNPKNSMIAFSSGLINKMTDQEIEAVAAHELTHIMNLDTRLMLVAIIFVGIIQTIAYVFMRLRFSGSGDRKNGGAVLVIFLLQIIVFILGFVIAAVVQATLSRKREYLADAGSVELVKTSQPLISALEKIATDSRIEAVGNANVAQMFIENPLAQGSEGFFAKLFSTHPPLAERIKTLQAIG